MTLNNKAEAKISYAPRLPVPGNLDVTSFLTRLLPRERITFDELAMLVTSVKKLFAALGIEIKPLSTLAALFRHVEATAAQWASGQGQDIKTMIDTTTAMRIVDAILAAKDDPGAVTCYRRIAKKDVDLFSPMPSQGKDALWELQLLKTFKSRGVRAVLSEPDINVLIGDLTIPVACKKIYSPKNLEGQLRSAGTQLAKSGTGGIVALNIDAQLPVNHLIVSRTGVQASNALAAVAHEFLAKNQSLLRRMLQADKFDAVLVSVSCPMENKTVRPRFNVGTESLIWCPESFCSAEAAARVDIFRKALKLVHL